MLRALHARPDVLQKHQRRVQSLGRDLLGYLAGAPQRQDFPRVAYLCAEFAIAECLPIYSGGLGVLAGDHLKAASDLGLPLIGIGLLYRYGYFQQELDPSGYQRERYDRLDPLGLPLRPALRADGAPIKVEVPFPGRAVYAVAWCAQVGRVPLYLLDTDLPENREDDRRITGYLYGGDQDTRIRQEIVLGIGGARLLRALDAAERPDICHMNEGHSAFVALELARERLESGEARDFGEAIAQVAPRLAFTSHTPVAAGHDAFPPELVEQYFGEYRAQLGLSAGQFMALGRRDPEAHWERFSMTVLALRSSDRRNGVSQLHGVVSRQMWAGVGLGTRETPPSAEMEAITNGVHTATWVGPEMGEAFDSHLGRAWRQGPHQERNWFKLESISPEALWVARTAQRARLLERVEAMVRAEGGVGLSPGITAERALVVGFARRFATYKRAALLLQDPDWLAGLMSRDPERQLIVVFAGKAHPKDDPGKLLLQRIVHASREERFRGRLVFLQNYSVELARLMVQGSDVWLNTPRRPEEASGTSGMKATLNGALHLSELDGWWDEAYQPEIGWGIGRGIPEELSGEARDAAEGGQLAEILEGEVYPLFFARDARGIPPDWLSRVSRSIRTLGPRFSAHRMVAEYGERVYLSAHASMSQQGQR